MDGVERSGRPEVGCLVRDGQGRIGKLMAYTGRRAWLRPVGGGREWDVDLRSICPVEGEGPGPAAGAGVGSGAAPVPGTAAGAASVRERRG